MKRIVLLFNLVLLYSSIILAQLTPQDAIKQMSRGINIGNTLDPPDEGGWNNPKVQEYYFDDYKAAGFTCVRIPITWGGHTSNLAPYTINNEWLNRVEQIVDWGLSRNLLIVINAHHESWLKDNASQANKDRFDAIWTQIAERFKNKSDKLLFEIINEPNPMTESNVNSLNARVLNIIRNTNPTRIVLFSGYKWSGCGELVTASIPNDNYLIGYFHSYDPYLFGLQEQVNWGSANDLNEIKALFDKAKTWSDAHNIPVFLGEFGAISQFTKDNVLYIKDFNSRMLHYATYVEQAMKHNIAYAAWDDGGDFKIYLRADRKWNEIIDIITNFSPKNPTNISAVKASGTSVKVSWTNRIATNDSIYIIRGGSATAKTKIAALKGDVSEFIDEKPLTGKYNYYRVVAHFNNENDTDLISYPVRISTTFITGDETIENIGKIVLFPNPVHDFISISLPENERAISLRIYSISGNMIKEIKGLNNRLKIPVDELKKGVYMLKLKTSKSNYKQKIIKE